MIQKRFAITTVLVLFFGLVFQALTPTQASAQQSASTDPDFFTLCGPSKPGYARCLSVAKPVAPSASERSASPSVTTTEPVYYTPKDLQSAYNLKSAIDRYKPGTTVAIVDAYDNPNAEADLAVYRTTYGLPPCTTANGCFKKIAQDGSTNYPAPDEGWGMEINLDIQMVSAICPKCKILLVEAKDNSFDNLVIAVSRAGRTPGVVAISNSYGGEEFPEERSMDNYYNFPGKAVTVSSGDEGYLAEYPASSKYVVAVGGTSLYKSARGTWYEKVWNGAGSGCSKYISKPSWQKDSGCRNRTVADVAAVADPNTGVAVYDSYLSELAEPGWYIVGGTSASAPIIGAMFALTNNPVYVNSNPASYLYNNNPFLFSRFPFLSTLYDITSGSNGTCRISYLCNGVKGYDGPTGIGSPLGYGVKAFER